jgi:THO complex subunit 2
MEDLEADFAARVRREMGGSGNALTQSGALKDDDSPSTSANASGQGAGATNMTSEEIDNLPRQRVMLCESLLAIGHLPPAMFMLSKWPVMAQSSELVSDLLLRVVQYSLEPAYQTIARSEGDAKRGPNYRMHFPFAVPEPTLTTISPEPAPTEKKRFVFFYNGWQENIQRWHRIDEVVAKVTPFAKFVGPQGARNVAVLVWLCRIGVAHQQTDVSNNWSLF